MVSSAPVARLVRALQPDARARKAGNPAPVAPHLCSLTDKVEQILARADWMLPELLTGRRITRLLGTVM